MVMKKFRGRRLRKTVMAVRAEGPRSWRQREEVTGCLQKPSCRLGGTRSAPAAGAGGSHLVLKAAGWQGVW